MKPNIRLMGDEIIRHQLYRKRLYDDLERQARFEADATMEMLVLAVTLGILTTACLMAWVML